MLGELRRVVDPGIGLKETMANWPGIAVRLQERPRKRKRQLMNLGTVCKY